jgi:hypothetical protein
VIVLQINIVSVGLLETKRYPQVSRDIDRPRFLMRALQLVKPPSRKVHIGHFTRRIENVKLASDSVSVLRWNSSKIAGLKELPSPL